MASIDELYEKQIASYCHPNHGIMMGGIFLKGSYRWHSLIIYFYTERIHQKNRFLVEDGSDCICVKEQSDGTYSEEYRPVRMVNGTAIVSSGRESEAIHSSLLRGKGFYDSLRFVREKAYWGLIPGYPFYTPRIFGLRERNGNYVLSILKQGPQLNLYEYSCDNRFISTFQPDGTPFSGEPIQIDKHFRAISVSALAEQIWEHLDPNTRVSLFVRCTDMRNGFPQTVILNQFGKCSYSAPKKPIWPTRRNRK